MKIPQLHTGLALAAALIAFSPSVLCAAGSSDNSKPAQFSRTDAAKLEGRQVQLREMLAQDRTASGEKLTAKQRTGLQAELDDITAKLAAYKNNLAAAKPVAGANGRRPELREPQRAGHRGEPNNAAAGSTARLEARAAELRQQLGDDASNKLTAAQRQQLQNELDAVTTKLAKLKR